MFIAAFPPQMSHGISLRAHQWIKKIWFIYYSAIKKDKIMLFTGNWVEPEVITLSKISQTQKDKCFAYMQNVEKIKMRRRREERRHDC
jgi:hypothetical protein